MESLSLATFRANITPPVGSPLCGGWIRPVQSVTDPLHALGVVLLGAGDPIVLCALDWCAVAGEDHRRWREALAAAVRTAPDRVAVQCVHPHNAPLTSLAAQRLISPTDLPAMVDVDAFDRAVADAARAAAASLDAARPVTEIRAGQAPVERVASNRRITGPDGTVRAIRFSACADPALRAEPEGLIDPMLRTVSFWSAGRKLAALHAYATHPMSYYGDGRVTGDFCAIARERLTAAEGALHIHFTGCAGDIAPGKYNDGSPAARTRLADRIHSAMLRADAAARPLPPAPPEWRTWRGALPTCAEADPDLRAEIVDPAAGHVRRKRAALILAAREHATLHPMLLTSLHLGAGAAILLHLPGEPFIAYQLHAAALRPEAILLAAAYGDYGPGYIPLAEHHGRGGYELTWTFVAPAAEPALRSAIRALLL